MNVGTALGTDDGIAVGSVLGIADGMNVGTALGTDDGIAVGRIVGLAEG